MKKNLSTLLLHAAILASPLLGQQTGLALLPGGVARARISPARRGLTASGQLALSAARIKRADRQLRNLHNHRGFSNA